MAEKYTVNSKMKPSKRTAQKALFDMALNIFSTAIPTVALQLLILPSLSNYMDGDSYGLMVTILAALNVIPSTVGNVLNNVRLLHEKNYENMGEKGDFQVFLMASQIINLFVMLGISVHYLGVSDFIGIVLLVGVGILWLGREYYIVAFRLNLNYIAILMNNLFLVAGYGIGWIIFIKKGYWQSIYLMGYLMSWLHLLRTSSIMREPLKKTTEFKAVLNDSVFLLISNILARAMNYADKILLYPLLGGTMVSVYYAATIFSKVVSLAITPINSVALSYLSKMDKKPNSLFKWTYLLGIAVCTVGYIMAVTFSRPILSILYPQYVDMAMNYIWITSGTIVVSVLTSMITPFVLCYFNTKWQIWINGITTAVYIIVSMVFLKVGGLKGFCVGALVANLIKLLITTYIYLRKSSRESR